MCGDKDYPFSGVTNYGLEYVPNSDLPLDRWTRPDRELLTSSQSDSPQDREAHLQIDRLTQTDSDSRPHRMIHLKTEILTQRATHVLTE